MSHLDRLFDKLQELAKAPSFTLDKLVNCSITRTAFLYNIVGDRWGDLEFVSARVAKQPKEAQNTVLAYLQDPISRLPAETIATIINVSNDDNVKAHNFDEDSLAKVRSLSLSHSTEILKRYIELNGSLKVSSDLHYTDKDGDAQSAFYLFLGKVNDYLTFGINRNPDDSEFMVCGCFFNEADTYHIMKFLPELDISIEEFVENQDEEFMFQVALVNFLSEESITYISPKPLFKSPLESR